MYHASVPTCRISTYVMVDFAAWMVLQWSSMNDPFSLVPSKSKNIGLVECPKYIFIWAVSSDLTSSSKIPVWYFKHNSKSESGEISSHTECFIYFDNFPGILMKIYLPHGVQHPPQSTSSSLPSWIPLEHNSKLICYILLSKWKLRDINIFDPSRYNRYVFYTCTTLIWIIIG